MDHQQVNNRYQKTSTLMKHSLTAPPIVCDKCKNTYASKQSLSNHKRICNGPKVCDNCNETFTSSQGLSNHKRWKCQPIVSAAGIGKKAIDGTDSVSSIVERVISPLIATTMKNEEQRKEDEENEVTTIINNLSGTKKASLTKLLNSLKKSNVENNELILPKIFNILRTIPRTDRIPIELLVYDIDQKRVNTLEKAVFTYVTKHDRKELLSMIEQFKKNSDIDIPRLKDLVSKFDEHEYDDHGNLLSSQILQIVRSSTKIKKLDKLRFEILLTDLDRNRFRINQILMRLNGANNEENYINQLHSLAREELISENEFDTLYSSRNKRDISNVANIIKLTKIGRGVRFLPRNTRELFDSLNTIVELVPNSTNSVLKTELFMILDKLLQ